MDKKYKVHQYDNFYTGRYHYRGTNFFRTLKEAEAFAEDHNAASKRYGFTSYYVVDGTEERKTAND